MTEGIDWAYLTAADVQMIERATQRGVDYIDFRDHYVPDDEEEDVD